MSALLRLSGDLWVNVDDIVYLRPSETLGRTYVELRTGLGFETDQPLTSVIDAIEALGVRI